MSKIHSKGPNWDSLSRTIYRESRKNASVFFSRFFRIITFRFHRTNTVIKLFDKAVDDALKSNNKEKIGLLEWKFIDLFTDAKLNKKQREKISIIQAKLFAHCKNNSDPNQALGLNNRPFSEESDSLKISNSSGSDTNLGDLSSDDSESLGDSGLSFVELDLDEPQEPQIQGRQEVKPELQAEKPKLMLHSSYLNALEDKYLIIDVPGDGDCFFHSLAYQVYPKEYLENPKLVVLKVRNELCDYMFQKRTDFEYLIEDDFDTHLKTMRKLATKTGSRGWGGQAELIAATKKYDRPLQMFTSYGFEQDLSQGVKPFQVFGEERRGKPLHMLYNGRNHWEALVPLNELA